MDNMYETTLDLYLFFGFREKFEYSGFFFDRKFDKSLIQTNINFFYPSNYQTKI